MGSIHDAVALLCWLDRERIISALEAEIDELADDEHALSPADRAKKESALLDQILESERVEEALIEAAEAEGASVQRRRQCRSARSIGFGFVTDAAGVNEEVNRMDILYRAN